MEIETGECSVGAPGSNGAQDHDEITSDIIEAGETRDKKLAGAKGPKRETC